MDNVSARVDHALSQPQVQQHEYLACLSPEPHRVNHSSRGEGSTFISPADTTAESSFALVNT